jgi:hypothetical protein
MQKMPAIKKRKLLYTPVGITLLFILTLYIGYSVFELYGKYAEARDKKNTAAAALHDAENRRAQVQSELDKLSTDRGREEVIREKFNVTKEGEGVVVIPGDETSGDKETGATSTKKEGFFSKLFGN